MFAYVRYIDDDICRVVSTEKIKNFRPDDPKLKDFKYMVEWEEDGQYYPASITVVKDTLNEIRTYIQKKRINHKPKNMLVSNPENTEDEWDANDNKEKRKNKAAGKSNQHDQGILKEYSSKKNSEQKDFKQKKTNEYCDNKSGNTVNSVNDKAKTVEKGKTSAESKKNSGKEKDGVQEKGNSSEKVEKDLQIVKLKKEIGDLKLQLSELSELNLQLQREVIDVVTRLVAKPVGECRITNNVAKQPGIGEVTENGEVHIGQNIFLKKTSYDTCFAISKTNSQFVRNMAVAVFGINELVISSVTGKNNKQRENKNALEPTKLRAVYDIFKFYLMEKKTDEVKMSFELGKINEYIRGKISDLNRLPRSSGIGKEREKGKGTSSNKTLTEEVIKNRINESAETDKEDGMDTDELDKEDFMEKGQDDKTAGEDKSDVTTSETG